MMMLTASGNRIMLPDFGCDAIGTLHVGTLLAGLARWWGN